MLRLLDCSLICRLRLHTTSPWYDRRQVATRPPSTASVTPCTKLASSLARRRSPQQVPQAEPHGLLVLVLPSDSPSPRGRLPSARCASGRGQRRSPEHHERRIRRPRPSSTVRAPLDWRRTEPCPPVRSWRPCWS